MNILSVIRDFWAGPMPRPVIAFLLTLIGGSILGDQIRVLTGVPVPDSLMYWLGQLTGALVITLFAYWLRHRYPSGE